jgi:hypothetical protein
MNLLGLNRSKYNKKDLERAKRKTKKKKSRKRTKKNNGSFAAFLGLFFGPFGYLYFGNIGKTILGLLLIIFVYSMFWPFMLDSSYRLFFGIGFALFFSWDCNRMAEES